MPVIHTPVKTHGGKHYLAEWICSLMPEHEHYLEPYFGGGSVLLRKDPEGVSEVICDLSGALTNFWRVLQDPISFDAFRLRCRSTPFSEIEWAEAKQLMRGLRNNDHPAYPSLCVKWAHEFFVYCRQSMAGRQDSFAPLTKRRLRRGMNEQVSAWLSSVEELDVVHARLKRVLILKPTDAMRLLPRYDKPKWLYYLDPPYLAETRESPDVYEHEMTQDQHAGMLKTCLALKHAKVMLSAYRSDMYDKALKGWNRHERLVDNKSSSKKVKERKTECLYCNF